MANLKRKKADIEFSRMIRERDQWTCQRCGAKHLPNSMGLHAAHIFTRSIKKTRHDPFNVHALCYGCHAFFHKHPKELEKWAREQMGDEEYEALEQRARRLK